jgi:hypothetical protein
MESSAPAARFTANEYRTVRVDRALESLYRDAYGNFSWIVDRSGSIAPGVVFSGATVPGAPHVYLTLKRDRRIKNKSAVDELQRRCEDALASVEKMERSVSAASMGAALTAGITGSAFIAGSVFALDSDLVWLSVPLGAVGLLGWAAGYLGHGRVRAKKAAEAASLIDAQYDIIYDTGEAASQLLA